MSVENSYIKDLENKIEQQEVELAKIQIFEDYTTEILNIAADGYESAKVGFKTCPPRDLLSRGKCLGECNAYEKILLLVKKWMRELE
jgi:hypothetical protein